MPPKQAQQADNGRNEYIPSFISKKPFYVADDGSSDADYLEHQRLQTQKNDALAAQQKWYDRGKKAGSAATKYRKGACENCGSMTHKTKECLSRPRKAGAKWTGKDIAADEIIQDVNMGWDAKRDRWNGYDASEYQNVIEEYNAIEAMKKQMKGESEGKEGEENEEGDRYEEETDMGRHQSTSTRNLRLREDTAKYLLNLDLESAKYDPKTRSMMDNGGPAGDDAAKLVAEEGFMRASGDASEFEKAQKYAWETQERGDKNKVHLQANPTSGEYFRRKEKEEAEAKKISQKQKLLELYGGQDQHAKDPKQDVPVVENEHFVEYDERGKIKGAPKIKTKSSYPEDVLINNHTSVWGSWWRDFQWGYACCFSTVKNSYCTGEHGRKAITEGDRLAAESEEVPKQIAWEEEAAQEEHVPNAVDSEQKSKLDAAARKRTLKEMKDGVDDDELEAYRKRRVAADDPMAKHLGKDELVH